MIARTLFLSAALLAVAGLGVFEAQVILRQREDLRELRKRSEPLEKQVAALRRERETALQELAAAERQLAELPAPAVNPAHAARQTEIKAWLARVKQLKQLFADRADQRIPEMQLLADEDWLRVAKRAAFDDAHHVRQALADLRSRATSKFFALLTPALRNYAKSTNDEPPVSILALASYFEKPIDLAILERYDVIKGSLSSDPNRVDLIARQKAPVDTDYDSRTEISASGGMWGTSGPTAWIPNFGERMRAANREYAQANNGASPTAISQTLPYFTPPLEPAKIELILRNERERGP